MKSPRILRLIPRSPSGRLMDNASEVSSVKESVSQAIASRDMTHSTSESEEAEESRTNEEDAEANASSDEEEYEDEDDEVSEYSLDEEDSTKKKKKGLFRRVFSPRRQKKKLLQQQESLSPASSYSSYEGSEELPTFLDRSVSSAESATDSEDEAEEAALAAEALAKDLEELGYNLDCESFITKGSTIVDEKGERYQPPSRKAKAKKMKKKRTNSKSSKGSNTSKKAIVKGSASKSSSRSSKNSKRGKDGRKKRLKKVVEEVVEDEEEEEDEEDEESIESSDSEEEMEEEECDTDIPMDVDIEENPTTGMSSGLVSDPTLMTNTPSKLKEGTTSRKNRRKYRRSGSPVSFQQSFSSLQELVQKSKRRKNLKEGKKTIPPPAMSKPILKPKNERTYRPSLEYPDDDSESESSNEFVPKRQGKKNPKHKSLSDNKIIEIPPGFDPTPQPPVIIEGMSIVMGNTAEAARRKERQAEKDEEKNVKAVEEFERVATRRKTPRSQDVPKATDAANHVEANEGPEPKKKGPLGFGRGKTEKSTPPSVAQAGKKKSFFGLSFKGSKNDKKPSEEETTKDDTDMAQRQSLPEQVPTPLQELQRSATPLLSSPLDEWVAAVAPEKPTYQRKSALKKSSEEAVYESLLSDETEDEQTMPPGQIEVTFNASMVDSHLVPVARVTSKKSPRARKLPIQPQQQLQPPIVQGPPKSKSPLQRFFHQHQERSSANPVATLPSTGNVDHKRGVFSMFVRGKSRPLNHADPIVLDASMTVNPTGNGSLATSSQGTSMQEEAKRVMQTLNIYESIVEPVSDRHVHTQKEARRPNNAPSETQSAFDRSRSEPFTREETNNTDLAITMTDLVNSVFLPKKSSTTKKSGGLLHDWFSLDVLGGLDWTKSAEATAQMTKPETPKPIKARKEEQVNESMTISHIVSKESVSKDSYTLDEADILREEKMQLESWLGSSNEPSEVPAEVAPPRVQPKKKADHVARTRSMPTKPVSKQQVEKPQRQADELKLQIPATLPEPRKKKKKGLFGRFRSLDRKKAPDGSEPETGKEAKDASVPFFHVEFNDDNDLLPNGKAKKPSKSKKVTKTLGKPRRQISDLPPQAVDESMSDVSFNNDYLNKQLSNSASAGTDSKTKSRGQSFRENVRKRFLESDSDMGDTWAEIADASLIVERAMDRLETLKSEDTEDPAKLKYLLSVVSDEDTIGDVEKALSILKKHAARLGVKETDLLLAVDSHDSMGITSAGNEDMSDYKSYRSLTFGEELVNVMNLFMKPKA